MPVSVGRLRDMSETLLFQLSRPSGHSYVLLASHVAYAVGFRTAIRTGQYLELASLLVSLCISVGYHVCDENLYCSLGLDIQKWHALDIWSTFFLICFVIGVRAMDFASATVRAAVRVVYLLLITTFVVIDRGNLALFGLLLASVAVLLVVRHVAGYAHSGNRHLLAMGLGVFAVSLGCFVLANTPVIGPVTWPGGGQLKPMDVPDTAVYWAFHSVWHFASAVAANMLLLYNAPSPSNSKARRRAA